MIKIYSALKSSWKTYTFVPFPMFLTILYCSVTLWECEQSASKSFGLELLEEFLL